MRRAAMVIGATLMLLLAGCSGDDSGPKTLDTLHRTTYALNGTAETHEHWADIDPIWADNNDPGPKVSIGDLLDFVAARC